MKKNMSLLVILFCIAVFLVGCGANNAGQSSSSKQNVQQEQPKEELPQKEVEIDNNKNSTAETTDNTQTKEIKETVTVSTNEATSKKEPQKQTETKEDAVTKPKQQSEPVVTKQTQEKPKPATNNSSNVAAPNQKVEGETKPNTSVNEVSITIRGAAETGVILKTTTVLIEEGDTVLDVLKKVTKQNRIQMEYRGSGATAYIEGIQNLYEFDKGPKSGWMFSVNGTFMKKGAGTTEVKPGDKIEWAYTLDLGRDLGATVDE